MFSREPPLKYAFATLQANLQGGTTLINNHLHQFHLATFHSQCCFEFLTPEAQRGAKLICDLNFVLPCASAVKYTLSLSKIIASADSDCVTIHSAR
jgi:hypothetical protein